MSPSTSLVPTKPVSGNEAKQKDLELDQMIGKVNDIDEIIISYLCPWTVSEFNKDLDNAKSYLLVGHWKKRKDLQLVSYGLFAEIQRNYSSINKEAVSWLKVYDIESLFKQQIRDLKLFTNALRYNGLFIKYANLEDSTYPFLLNIALQQNGLSLEFTNDRFKNDRERVLAAVTKDGRALQYASEALRRDRKVVLAAVQQHGWALAYACNELKNDPEIVLAAIKQRPFSIKFAGETLKDDPKVWQEAVKRDGLLLKLASTDVKGNLDVVQLAVRQNGLALQLASEELRNNFEVVLTAVQQDGLSLQHASRALRENPLIVSAAFEQNPLSSQYEIVNREDEQKAKRELEERTRIAFQNSRASESFEITARNLRKRKLSFNG